MDWDFGKAQKAPKKAKKGHFCPFFRNPKKPQKPPFLPKTPKTSKTPVLAIFAKNLKNPKNPDFGHFCQKPQKPQKWRFFDPQKTSKKGCFRCGALSKLATLGYVQNEVFFPKCFCVFLLFPPKKFEKKMWGPMKKSALFSIFRF
jgi:hypothetical protein